jgi:hypothetical protein
LRCRARIKRLVVEEHVLSTASVEDGELVNNDAILVLADNLRSSKKLLSPKLSSCFWETWGEDDVNMSHGRMDPTLKLYRNYPGMSTHNENVLKGLANGTSYKLERLF